MTDGLLLNPPSPINAIECRLGCALSRRARRRTETPSSPRPLGVTERSRHVDGELLTDAVLVPATSVTMKASAGAARRSSLRMRSGLSGNCDELH
jgi:hypothetical protein